MNKNLFFVVGLLLAVAGCSGYGGLVQKDGQVSDVASVQTQDQTQELSVGKRSVTAAVTPSKSLRDRRLVCPVETTSGRINKWTRPGANAYTGSVGYALTLFDVPESVKDKWRKLIKEKNFTEMKLKTGDRFCSMIYSARGYHHKWNNVEVAGDWTTSGEVSSGATVYSVVEGGLIYKLIKPEVCKNWSYSIYEIPSTSLLPSLPSVRSEVGTKDPYAIVVRFWDEKSIPENLMKKVLEVNSQESNLTYPFKDGAVSRDLDKELYSSFKRKEATTIKRCISAKVFLPKDFGTGTFRSCPGEHSDYPRLVYLELKLDRDMVLSKDAQFAVVPEAPLGCKVVYPRFQKNGGGYYLSSRPGELRASAMKGSPGMNFNTIISCSQNGQLDSN